jgi:hypothetical protein
MSQAGQRPPVPRHFIQTLRSCLVGCALTMPTAGNASQPVFPRPQQVVRDLIHKADWSECERAATSDGRFGSVVVTIFLPPQRDHSLTFEMAATKSLGIPATDCAKRRLNRLLASPGGFDHRGPRLVVTEELSFGSPRALLPAFSELSTLWAQVEQGTPAQRRATSRQLASLLPLDARLTDDRCIWLPGTEAMAQSLQIWQRQAGPLIDPFWSSTVEALVPGLQPVAGVAWPAERLWLITRRFEWLRLKGKARDLWTPRSGSGGVACLFTLDDRRVAQLKAAALVRGTCWRGGEREIFTAPRLAFPQQRQYRSVVTRVLVRSTSKAN